MRSLIVKRNKSFAGFLGKVQVYISDKNGDVDIHGQYCRKLGDLKNGEEKTFTIDTAAATVYVIGDISTKDFCVDAKAIPEGTAEMHLSGKVTLDPQSGNPFIFDK